MCNDDFASPTAVKPCSYTNYYVDASLIISTLTPKATFRSKLMVGTSWDMAFTTLQDALDIAIDGDTIRVAQGTYSVSYTHLDVYKRQAS